MRTSCADDDLRIDIVKFNDFHKTQNRNGQIINVFLSEMHNVHGLQLSSSALGRPIHLQRHGSQWSRGFYRSVQWSERP